MQSENDETGLLGQDRQSRTTRTGQIGQDRPGQDIQDRITGQVHQEGLGTPVKDSLNMSATIGQPKHDKQRGTSKPGQAKGKSGTEQPS